MINRSINLVGTFRLFWDPIWCADALDIANYQRNSDKLRAGTTIGPIDVDHYLPHLNPTNYKSFASSRAGKNMSPTTAQAVLPIILTTIQLRKTFVGVIKLGSGRKERLGSDIPPYIILTMELGIYRTQACYYYRVHDSQTKGLEKGVDEESGNSQLDFEAGSLTARRLDPARDRLASISTVRQVSKWYGDLADHRATKLF